MIGDNAKVGHSDDQTIGVTWDAYEAPMIGVLPPTMFGAPGAPVRILLELGRDVTTQDGFRDVDIKLIVGGIPSSDPEAHVASLAKVLQLTATIIESQSDIAVQSVSEGIEDRKADIALAEADLEHARAAANRGKDKP